MDGGGVQEIEELIFYDKNKELEETVEKEKERGVDEENGEEQHTSGGGVISNFISAMVSKESDEKGGEQEASAGAGGGVGGGGLIGSIVSHLADDATPESEEASILIHCIVHD